MNLFLKEVNYLSFSYSYLLTFLNKIFQGYGSNLSFNQNTEKWRLSYLKIKPKKTCDNEQNFYGPLIQNTAWLLDWSSQPMLKAKCAMFLCLFIIISTGTYIRATCEWALFCIAEPGVWIP